MQYQDFTKFKRPPDGDASIIKRILYRIADSFLIHWTPKPLHSWRNVIYRFFGARIGEDVKIDPGCRITSPWNLEIGDHVWIGYRTVIYGGGLIRIGNNVSISQNVFLLSTAHDIHKNDFPTIWAPIVIEDECWISSGVIVQMGVTVHKGAVVAAGSVVTKDIPEGMIAMGVPARPVKVREMATEV